MYTTKGEVRKKRKVNITMKELMIYTAINSDGETVWGIYKRKADLNWTCFYRTTNNEMSGLLNAISFALDYYKDCKVLLGGYWLDHEQLTAKRYEILDNM